MKLRILAPASLLLSAFCWTSTAANLKQEFGNLPLTFEKNLGQADTNIRYLARGTGYNVAIKDSQAELRLTNGHDSATIALSMVGQRAQARPLPGEKLATFSNYFLGRHPDKWLTGVPHFAQVIVPNALPGIDLIYHGGPRDLEYDFRIQPGADVSALRLQISGAESLRVDAEGDLVIQTAAGDIREHRPIAWQNVAGKRKPVAVSHRLSASNQVWFELGGYDHNLPLVIDPVISYSTYLAGSFGSRPNSIAVDSSGYAYIAGATASTNFPVTSGQAIQGQDGFVTKLNPSGTAIVYSVFLGGNATDGINAIAVDAAGNATVTGTTQSTDFPVVFSGSGGTKSLGNSSFVTRLNTSGTIVASRYIASGANDSGNAIALDAGGGIYVAGVTASTSFPLTYAALQPANPAYPYGTGFVAKFDAALNILYGTFLGGSGGQDQINAIAVDSSGDAYVVGSTDSSDFPTTAGVIKPAPGGKGSMQADGFLAEVNPNGGALIYSTLIGGSQQDFLTAVALDAQNNAYVSGYTQSTDFPTTPGAIGSPVSSYFYSLVAAKVPPGGASLTYSTSLGQIGSYLGTGIAVDSAGNAYIAATTSTNVPVTPGSLQPPLIANNNSNLALMKISADGKTRLYSTALGTRSGEILGGLALDQNEGVYLAGSTQSRTFPTTPNAYQKSSVQPALDNAGIVVKVDFSSPTLCNAVLSSPSASISGQGGTGSFSFTLADGCPWQLTTDAFSLTTITSPVSGFGNATVNFAIGVNNTGQAQTGTITVVAGSTGSAPVTFSVNEAAGSCLAPAFSPSSLSFPAGGGSQTVAVSIPFGCNWTPTASVPWISTTDNAPAGGSGTLTVSVAANSFSARSGVVTVATQNIPVTQSAGSCTLSLSSAAATGGASPFAGAVAVTTGPTCGWNVYSTVPWIQVSSATASGQGNGSVTYSVASNPGASARSGSLLIGDQILQITQAAGPFAESVSYSSTLLTAFPGHVGLGDGGPASIASVFVPLNLAFDSAGNLYVADSANGRIRKIDTSGIITTVAGGGGSLLDRNSALLESLSNPHGVTVDPTGTVYFTDATRVRTLAGGIVNAIAGGGGAGFSGDGGAAYPSKINMPAGIGLDTAGNIYFADTKNNRIRKISAAGTITTFAGSGTAGFGGDGGQASLAQLNQPTDLVFDSAGNLYFIDSLNYRVRKISIDGTISTIAGNGSNTATGDGPATLTGIGAGAGGIAVDLENSVLVGQSNGVIRAILGDGTIKTLVNSPYTAPIYGIVQDSSGNLIYSQANAILKAAPTPAFCSYSVSQPSLQPAGGGTVTVTVSASGPSCSWTAVPGVSWITVTSASGMGSGTVTFSIAANTDSGLRAALIPIGTQIIQILQAGTSLSYVPITPCRVVDTRTTPNLLGGPYLSGGSVRTFQIPSNVACGTPFSAQAYSLNVTVVPHRTLSYLSLWPSGQLQPVVSTMNSLDGRIKANAAIVPAGSNAGINVYATDDTDVILDINGYFLPVTAPGTLAFYPLTPCRLVDTRLGASPTNPGASLTAGVSRTLPLLQGSCNIPSTAQAYSLNFTAVPQGPLGYLTVSPTGVPRPTVSTLNALTGTVTANAAIIPAGTGGSIDVYASDATDLLVDINGYFGPPGNGGLSFYPLPPCRALDDRFPSGTAPFLRQNDIGIATSPCSAPATAQAYVANATVVPAGRLGYLTLWPQGTPQPTVSTLNSFDGSITSNLAIVPSTNGFISAFASDPTYLLVDISGYFAQ